MTIHDASIVERGGSALARLASQRTAAVIALRPSDGRDAAAIEPPLGRPLHDLAAGRVAVLEWGETVVPSLLRAAGEAGLGVSTGVAFGLGAGVEIGEILAQFAADPETDVLCLGLGRIGDPRDLLRGLTAVGAAGKPVVAVRSFGRDDTAAVRPGIARRRMIEAALGAAGVVFVDTAAAAVALAGILVRHPTRSSSIGGPIFVVEDPRDADRLATAIATRPSWAPGADGPIAVFEPAADGARPAPRPGAADGERIAIARVEDALAVLDGLDQWRRSPEPTAGPSDLRDDLAVALAQLPGGELGIVAASDFAAAAGIANLPFVVVATGAEAIVAGPDIGFPVVAKLVGRGSADKATAGGVVLGVARRKDLRKAVFGLRRAFRSTFVGALLQPQIDPRAELRVGSFHDPDWGAFVWARSAGALLGITDDLVVAPAPLTPPQARVLLSRLAVGPRFDGRDGEIDVDVEATVDAVVTVGRTAAALGRRLLDFTLHPLAVLEPGKGAFAIDVRVRLAPVEGARKAKPRR